MKLKDLEFIENALHALGDFAESNTDADESGIGHEMANYYNKSIEIITKEYECILNRNIKARAKRKVNKMLNS